MPPARESTPGPYAHGRGRRRTDWRAASGHQGPSVSCACVSFTRPPLAEPSEGNRGTCAPPDTWNAQFSPGAPGIRVVVHAQHGGAGP